MSVLKQTPLPGRHLLFYCGDLVEFRLESDQPIEGDVFLRTNLGNAAYHRKEIIEHVESGINPGFQDWCNLPMKRIDEFTFTIRLMLTEEGHFEGKCFVRQKDEEPVWAEGENVHLNVEPATYCCSNGVYCAFVRQFGENKYKAFSSLPDGITDSLLTHLDELGYSVIPGSGTFRDLIKELDHIFDRLNCRILHLLPVHPVPTVYGRMGRYGSPYAALDFTAVNPEYAEFDRKATPLDQFMELVDAVHRKKGKLFIDIAINHTGWAAKLHETHPEWLVRESDGTIHSPGAWGVTWGDLTELDHSKPELWSYLAGVFRTWCLRGVDGFRCDAGYMIPEPAWEYIIAKVREEFPETVFLLEGLGGDPAVTRRLLDVANMNWAYSELFQNYDRQQVEGYLQYAHLLSAGDGVMIHYAETHDNLRLAATSREYARMRTALSAMASFNGTFGFTNGVEWFAQEKIDVHEASALHWCAELNQVDMIGRLNRILALLPCFHNGSEIHVIDSHCPDAVMLGRTDHSGTSKVIIAVNLNTEHHAQIRWNSYSAPMDAGEMYDLISGKKIYLAEMSAGERSLLLAGGEVLCLTSDRNVLEQIETCITAAEQCVSPHLATQSARALVARILAVKNDSVVAENEDLDLLAEQLRGSPEQFFHSLYGEKNAAPFTIWNYPEDLHRQVMIPPGHFLLLKSPDPFRALLQKQGKVRAYGNSLLAADDSYFLLIPPQETPETMVCGELLIRLLSEEKLLRVSSPLLYLPEKVNTLKTCLSRKELQRGRYRFMCGNGRGGLIWQPVEPCALWSRYDALLLANLNPDYPENRHIMLRRFRIWSLYHAKSQFFSVDCLKSFRQEPDGAGIWEFELPVGNGLFADVAMKLEILPGANAVRMILKRHTCREENRKLCDAAPVRFIIRPDLEDRSFHNSTKASAGPEQLWSGLIREEEKSFRFAPADDRVLTVESDHGRFIRSDEWQYMVHQEDEAARGLDPDTDLFSPGYFEIALHGGETASFTGSIRTSPDEQLSFSAGPDIADEIENCRVPVQEILHQSLAQFVVKRDALKTVIAGYPWFLDWGRDTLIVARGLIADPQFRRDAGKILLQFASFARNGTIPNMICGKNADNRDTSDAPLWLFTACRDYCNAENSRKILSEILPGGKTLLETFRSLAEGILQGTPNGIKADPESMLVFSPAHFTWMDSNYPAGTPREGYPVEIQALWFAALRFLSEELSAEEQLVWKQRAEKCAESLIKYFVLRDKPYLSDCLHCKAGETPAQATADDHLRPNQLYAITLGAITNPRLCRTILESCSSLLIPGAIRSLADRDVLYPLPVRGGENHLLNDPLHPYCGRYEGDEDTRRKVAYHNGTAWTWQFPAYCEACYLVYGESGLPMAGALLDSMAYQMDAGCLAHTPEILDGDFPHQQRGCHAQAWGISEYFRVRTLLSGNFSRK
ncbi:MAG: glycogen debranching enzyme N-terminal domain-containing protein [Lentisphaeria bacterium]|nr:glycogen debranching enzyme N-terminal domain-containing protein [Lentisphaeria bacterium]